MPKVFSLLHKLWYKKYLLILIMILAFFVFNAYCLASTDKYYQARTSGEINLTNWQAELGESGLGLGSEILWGLHSPEGEGETYGLAQPLGNLVAYMTITKPISNEYFLADLKNRFSIDSPVYAAPGVKGSGFTVLEPVLQIWKSTRNVSYLFFTVIFIAVGFMVLFRVKINPQTVVSIQNALPRVIVSLLLVTFSYSIFAFIIDIAFLGNNLLYEIFGNDFITSSGTPTWDAMPSILNMLEDTNVLGKLIKGLVGIAQILAAEWQGVFELIMAFILVSTVIKIFFSLLTSFITLILTAIFAPFAFLWNAMPGQGDSGSKIMKTALSKALVFPAMTFLINLALYFTNPDVVLDFSTIPPLNPNVSVGGEAFLFQNLIALGILMTASNIAPLIDDALAIKAPPIGAGGQDFAGALRKIPIIGSLAG